MKEVWKNIPGYEGIYKISSFSRIKSLTRYAYIGGNKSLIKERILKQPLNNSGYAFVCLTKNGVQKCFLVHRILAKIFIPNPFKKPIINHKNGIKTDNSLNNLEWCTGKENSSHAFRIGLCNAEHVTGERNWQTKLTNNQVIAIRELMNKTDKPSQKKLAEEYGVCKSVIYAIVNRKTWKNI